MAKVKNSTEINPHEIAIDENCATTESLKEVVAEDKIELDSRETDKPKKATKSKTNDGSKSEIPDRIKDVLKVFSNYPELLITTDGRVYTPQCKLAVAKTAILYKNPFYNS